MLLYRGLYEYRTFFGIKPGAEVVCDHIDDVGFQFRRILVTGRQGMPVRNEKETFIFILELHPVFERSKVVSEMQFARRPHAAEHYFFTVLSSHMFPAFRIRSCAGPGRLVSLYIL